MGTPPRLPKRSAPSPRKTRRSAMEDRIPYKGWHLLLSRQGDRWVADLIPKGQSSARLVIHAATMAALVNAAFGVIDDEERERIDS